MNQVFHVGLMKSGTTYIQEILSNNRTILKDLDWSYPGLRLNQQHSFYSLCGTDIPWVKKEYPESLGKDLLKKLNDKNNNIIVSAEALSSLSEPALEKLFSKVKMPSRVVFTVRGLLKTLPSAWQQYLKGWGRTSFEEFISRLSEQRLDMSGFWRTYAYGRAIKKWSKYASVNVVVVPDKAKTDNDLWMLFSDAAGLPLMNSIKFPEKQPNISLSLEAAKILKNLNKKLPRNSERTDSLRNAYLNEIVFPLREKNTGHNINVPESMVETVSQWNNEEYELLKQFSSEIYGDIEDLLKVSDMKSTKKMQVEDVAKQSASQIELFLNKR
jgi:hypothetical protein